jgi:hypothetical protein
MEWSNEQSIRIEALNIASREAVFRSFVDDLGGGKKTTIEIAELVYEFINKGEKS